MLFKADVVPELAWETTPELWISVDVGLFLVICCLYCSMSRSRCFKQYSWLVLHGPWDAQFGADVIAERVSNSPAPSTLLMQADPKVFSSRTFNRALCVHPASWSLNGCHPFFLGQKRIPMDGQLRLHSSLVPQQLQKHLDGVMAIEV